MTATNVGDIEAAFRVVLATTMFASIGVAATRLPLPFAIGYGVLVGFVAYLILVSAISRECPVHERAGIDTRRD